MGRKSLKNRGITSADLSAGYSSGDRVIGKPAKLTLPIGLEKLNKLETSVFSASPRLRSENSFSDQVSDHPITPSPACTEALRSDHPIHDKLSICKHVCCFLLLFCSLAHAQG